MGLPTNGSEHVTLAKLERTALTQMVFKLFDHWNLSLGDQAALLGLDFQKSAVLSRYRAGKPIGADRDQLDRVGHLLAIHKILRSLFPQNRDLAYRWMSTRNRAFENLTPVDVVKSWGFLGLLRVRSYLERSIDAQ